MIRQGRAGWTIDNMISFSWPSTIPAQLEKTWEQLHLRPPMEINMNIQCSQMQKKTLNLTDGA